MALDKDRPIEIDDDILTPRIRDDMYYYNVKVLDADTRLGIGGAEVRIKPNGTLPGDLYSSNSNGTVLYPSETLYRTITCDVSATGYQTIHDEEIFAGRNITNYNNIYLTPNNTTYYYVLYVKDIADNTNILDAVVTAGNNIQATLVSGRYTYMKIVPYGSSAPSPLQFSINVSGYSVNSGLDEGQNYITISPVQVVVPSQIPIVYFQKETTENYYVISVVDSMGNPEVDIDVETYYDLSYNTPQGFTLPINSPYVEYAVFEVVRDAIVESMGDNIGCNIEDINFLSKFSDDLNVQSADILGIVYYIETALDIEFPNNLDYSQFYKIKDLIEYIQGNYSVDFAASKFRTDSLGLICIPTPITRTIYVKGISPNVNWSKQSSPLNVTNSRSVPGATLITSPTISNYYYCNVCVLDECTQTPIQGVTVTFYDSSEETVFGTQTTDSNGRVSFSRENYDDVVRITMSKPTHYDDNGDDFNSTLDSTHWNYTSMYPKNTIQVVHKDTQNPMGNITLRVYQEGTNGQTLIIKEGKTYSSGFFDTLNNDVFSSNKSYVTVLNYSVTAEERSNLTKRLHTGENTIELPDAINPSDYNDFALYDQYSVNNIKKQLDEGTVVDYNSTSRGEYKINISEPDSIDVYDIFEPTPVVMENNQKNVVGSVDVTLKSDLNDLRLKVINRYSGYYNPIFKDILFYNDFESGNNTCPFSNTRFDPDYSDNQGKFGVINNLWFHKVNDNKNMQIIQDLNPFYPLIGQYALDSRDYNIFESNWDMNHYTRQIDTEHSEPCQNIASMKNGLCMFGSKYLNVPETIEIYGFNLGTSPASWYGEWNDEWITSPEACPGEVMFKEVNDNSVDFYFFFTKRILRFFREKLEPEFKKYMGGGYTYGNEGVEDDIDEYVKKNILKLYKLDKVRVFIRRIKKGVHNSKIENEYYEYLSDYLMDYDTWRPVIDPDSNKQIPLNTAYFRSHGFDEINTITLSKVNRDDFDRKLVYNLRNGMQEDFGFTFVLKKI